MVMADTVQRPGRRCGAVVRIHGTDRGSCHDHGLHAALLPTPIRKPGRSSGRRRSLAQFDRRRRQAAWRHRQPELRQSGTARDHGPVRRLRPRHGRGRAARSTSRSCRAMSRSTTKPMARRSCRHRSSAASVCSTDRSSGKVSPWPMSGSDLDLVLVGETHGWLGSSTLPPRDLRARRGCAAAGRARSSSGATAIFVRHLIDDRPGRRLPRCRRWRPAGRAWRKWRWHRGIGLALEMPDASIQHEAGWLFGEDQGSLHPGDRSRDPSIPC